MELTPLRYFLEVASTQHMTLSAQRLHIAQPALSRTIRKLEADLGVPLFIPKGRNIRLTEYGEHLASRLAPLLRELDSLPGELETLALLSGETIHLSVLAASTIVTEAIIAYQATHKGIRFQLVQDSPNDLWDIEITGRIYSPYAATLSGNQEICTEKIFLAVPKQSPYAGRTSISLQEVRDEGFISLMGARQFRSICDKLCQTAGIHPRVIFESDNPSAVRNMITANLGVGFWPEFTWGAVDPNKVLLLEIEEPVCRRDILITYHRNKADNRNVEDFFRFLKNDFSKRRQAAHRP